VDAQVCGGVNVRARVALFIQHVMPFATYFIINFGLCGFTIFFDIIRCTTLGTKSH
jgi:hypothetical protein